MTLGACSLFYDKLRRLEGHNLSVLVPLEALTPILMKALWNQRTLRAYFWLNPIISALFRDS